MLSKFVKLPQVLDTHNQNPGKTQNTRGAKDGEYNGRIRPLHTVDKENYHKQHGRSIAEDGYDEPIPAFFFHQSFTVKATLLLYNQAHESDYPERAIESEEQEQQ